MAITVSNKGAITEHPMVVVLSMAAAAATSTDMVPLTVTENKHQSRHRRGNRGNADHVDYIGIVIVIRVAYAPPLPAALVGRGTTRVLCRARPRRAEADVVPFFCQKPI